MNSAIFLSMGGVAEAYCGGRSRLSLEIADARAIITRMEGRVRWPNRMCTALVWLTVSE